MEILQRGLCTFVFKKMETERANIQLYSYTAIHASVLLKYKRKFAHI